MQSSRRGPSGFSLAAASYVFAVVMAGTTMPTPLYPEYEQTYSFASLTTTTLFAVYAAGVIVALVTFGQASARLGRRPVLGIGIVLALASAIVFLCAGQLWMLYVGRVLSGLSAGIFTATGTAAVIENAPSSRKNLASALATAANIGGLGLGILMAGVVAELSQRPLRMPFVIHAVLLLLAGAAMLVVRETVETDLSRRILQIPRVPDGARSLFVAASVGAVAGFAMCGIYSSVAPGFLTSVLGIGSAATIGIAVSLVFIASAVAQILLRPLPDRTLIVVGAVALVAGMAVLVLALSAGALGAFIASALLAGTGQGVLFMTGMRAVLGNTDAQQRTQATTSYFVVAYLSISLPSIAAGVVSAVVDLKTTGIVAAVVIAVVGVVAALNARKFDAGRRL